MLNPNAVISGVGNRMQTVQFTPPLADSSHYPTPTFPVLQKIKGLCQPEPREVPGGTSHTMLTTRARYALAMIAKAYVNAGDRVLLPAYHCPAMIEPFVWAGCKIEFYPVNSDLTPMEREIADLLHGATALLLTRYFGFECNIRDVAEIARKHNCLVIEDLAHAAFSSELVGDIGVTSLPKFYPVDTGSEIHFGNNIDPEPVLDVAKRYKKTHKTNKFTTKHINSKK